MAGKRFDFEQGPIRPPSEAASLLLRVTRNCPWNRCAFCPVYKRRKFSRRPVEEVLGDIEAMKRAADEVRRRSWHMGLGGEVTVELARQILSDPGAGMGLRTLAVWLYNGQGTVFLQDGDSFAIKVQDLERVLVALKEAFPEVRRVTTYARSRTCARRSVEELETLRKAGLDRIHIGLESGSDAVLKLMSKGVTAAQHIEAGLKVKAAGMELSEYVMPGLGGTALSDDHADETARVMNAIEPSFIRLRTLAVRRRSPLAEMVENGEFEQLTEVRTVREIRRMLGKLRCRSALGSDHILNLLQELEGDLPADQEDLLELLDSFLQMEESEQRLFVLGRRLGAYRYLADLGDPERDRLVRPMLDRIEQQGEGAFDAAIRELMQQFV